MLGELHKLGVKYRTGKANEPKTFMGRNYLDVYEFYLESMKNQPINILEIGVKDGRSLKVWEEYFPKANIVGLDIDPSCKKYAGPRTHVEIGSQADPAVLNKLACLPKVKDIGFHAIIDDGSHVVTHILESFKHLWKLVTPGGFYAIEDLRCSYLDLEKYDVRKKWPGMKYNPKGEKFVNDRQAFELWFCGVINSLDHRRDDVCSVQFWHEICFLLKG